MPPLLKHHFCVSKNLNMSFETYLFIDVPVQAVVFQNKPVLLPFLRKVTLCISLSPQPTLAVSSAQRLAGNTPPTQRGQTSSWNNMEEMWRQRNSRTENDLKTRRKHKLKEGKCVIQRVALMLLVSSHFSVNKIFHKMSHPNVAMILGNASVSGLDRILLHCSKVRGV